MRDYFTSLTVEKVALIKILIKLIFESFILL